MNKKEIYNKVFRHEISADEAFQLLEEIEKEQEYIQFPLTSIQKPLWLSNVMYPDNSAYNLSVPIIVNEDIDEKALLKACAYVVSLHASLRTVFSNYSDTENSEPYQKVKSECEFSFDYDDISDKSFTAQKEIVLEAYKRPFNLAKDKPLRVCNFKLGKEKHLILLVVHHIISDGPSLAVLASHFVESYCTYKIGEKVEINKPKATYKQFVEWQQEMLKSDFGIEAREFWERTLSNGFSGIDLPKEDVPNGAIIFDGDTVLKPIDSGMLHNLRNVSNQCDVSLYVLTLGAFLILLNRYSGQEKLQVGSPMYGRPSSKYSDCIGFFSNTVPIYTELPLEKKFSEYVLELKQEVKDIMKYSTYPFLNVANELGKTTDNMFTIVFAVQSFLKELGRNKLDSFGSKSEQDSELVNSIQQEGVFEIFLELQENETDAMLAIKYKEGMFSKDFINQIIDNYIHLLKDICNNPTKLIYQLDCVCEKEKDYLLNIINDTKKKFEPVCIHEIIDRNAEVNPKKSAIVFQGNSLTYKELRDKSNELANLLVQKGIHKGDVVGVYIDRSSEVIIAMLALFKIGAVYLPYDTKLPLERLKYIIGETDMKMVLTNNSRLHLLNFDIPKISVEYEFSNRKYNEFETEFRSETKFNDLAYMIYTSGSTGTPKGVQVWHSSLTNIIQSMLMAPGVSANDYTISIASISFDMSLLEILPILTVGGTIEMLASDIIDDQIILTEKLHEMPVTYFCATPSLYEILFVTGFKSNTMTRAWVAGDALNSRLAQRMIDMYGVVWNMCGPTETAIITSIQKITDAKKVGIGRPIHNYQIYILDRYKQLLPKGSKGELYIGGAGVHQPCYYKREEINQKKFIRNPFDGNSYLHCSGDLVSFMDDGNLKYYCRIDGMVKFRGLRIELEEIDNQLLKIDSIRNAATVIRTDNSNHSEIVSFVILKSHQSTIDATTLSKTLGKLLPIYMLPNYYVELEDMPINFNAKINRKYLSSEQMDVILENYHGSILVDENQKSHDSKKTEETVICKECETIEGVEQAVVNINYDSDELLSYVNQELKQMVMDVVELDETQVGNYTPFSNLEFDSLRFVKLSVSIKNQFSIELSPVIFNNLKNISSLAVYIVSNFSNEVNQKYREVFLEEGTSGEIIEVTNMTEYNAQETLVEKKDKKDNKRTAVTETDVAIIGMAYQLPFGADEAGILEQICSKKQSCESSVDREGVNLGNRLGYFIKDVWGFDFEHFHYSKQDSAFIDPQYRLLLQLTTELFADAGYQTTDVENKNIGVFLGATREEYKRLLYQKGHNQCDSKLITNSYLASHISSYFNVVGPTKVLDATLSSSQSLEDAIHSICKGECQMAIAGGVNIFFSDQRFQELSRENRLSQNSKTEMFCEDNSGVIPAEGVAVLLLKPLAEAMKDKDKVYAVIKHVQSQNSNCMLVPRQDSLTQLFNQVYSDKTVCNLDYIDSIGLGTKFSDENEFLSYVNVLGKKLQNTQGKKIVLGSSRSQFGDMEAVSIYVSIIKLIYMMKNHIMPASLSSDCALNNRIKDLYSAQIEFTTKTQPWNSNRAKLAAITEIGSRGRNTHIILEEFVPSYAERMPISILLHKTRCLPPAKTLFQSMMDKHPVLLGSGNIHYMYQDMIQYWKDVNDTNEPKTIGNLWEDSNDRITHLLVKLQSTGKMMEVVMKGKGRPILMIPGFGLAASQFLPQFSDELFNRQMIVIHMPGVGLSESCEDVSFEAISSSYMEVIDILGIHSKIDLLGTSWGGVLAQFMAIRYEERCNVAILANTSAKLTVNSHVGLKELVYDDFESAGATEARHLFDDSTCISDDMALKYEAVLYSGQGKTEDFLNRINIPTLILAGAKDKILPVELSELMHREISDSELHIFENSGHSSNLSVPEEFNRVCEEFLHRYGQ